MLVQTILDVSRLWKPISTILLLEIKISAKKQGLKLIPYHKSFYWCVGGRPKHDSQTWVVRKWRELSYSLKKCSLDCNYTNLKYYISSTENLRSINGPWGNFVVSRACIIVNTLCCVLYRCTDMVLLRVKLKQLKHSYYSNLNIIYTSRESHVHTFFINYLVYKIRLI